MLTRSPTSLPLARIVPTGSSRTPWAPRTSGTMPTQAGSADRRPTIGCPPSGPGLPRNTASIAKRMKNMWMPFVAGIQSPWPGSSSGRPMRPMNRAQNEPAISTSVARVVPLVVLRAATGTRRGSSRDPAKGFRLLGADVRATQVDDDQDDRGPEDDDEQRGEDAPDQREQHLDRGLGGHLLGALASLDPELLRLDLEDLRDRDAELLGLDDRADEVRQRLDLGPRDDVAERLAPGL